MFWDGTRWVDDRPATGLRAPRRRVRDWLATVPIILLVPALLSPFVPVLSATTQLTVSGVPVPGGQLSIVGSGLPARQWLQLTWDRSAAGMPTDRTSSTGTFTDLITVPVSALAGQHLIGVVPAKSGKGGGTFASTTTRATTPGTVLASVTITLNEGATPTPDSSVPPASTLDPTLAATLVPTVAPTQAPTLAATLVPTVAPTLAPTHVPTVTPTLTPTLPPTSAPTVQATLPPTPTSAPTPTPPSGPVLTFEDSFTGTALRSAWRPMYGPGDPGDRLDTDCMGDLSQVKVADSIATITVERNVTPSGRPFAGACMATYGTFAQRYGTWEARVRYDEAKGTWPSWFLITEGHKSPYPEIDVFEAYGDAACLGPGAVAQTVHWTNDGLFSTSAAGGNTKSVPLANSSDWHVHKIVWTATRLDFYIDGVLTNSSTHVPQVAMYPIFVFGVGANSPSCRPDATTPAVLRMDIDFIRVYAP